ncbi:MULTISPECIES: GntR family transcriptional regulator [Microbacterium]|uniref:GntR family transcriptional regulator n=1 Tax=Microbacterium aurugineum TaxID=2851642 RepID=A0ABY4IVT2_9MICO|nr:MULTISPECIES: GntR family transcriptional regulator [Microbacterium]MCZ4302297.1 GntR family transcriptional regulator [Microbacterium oxydans]QEA27250.1 GntR family transcriptional regulator [Microbacterium sp. CBA3102]TCJ23552.1 GntR family transcriptional regulator [Microbacterium sp. PI-1]TFB15821.1 GntR family transcriptional regulator [Microbacterium sp. 3H14]UPL16875.1 GntR family transcriptional regulator [Microbacterium aurugineum]
MRNIGSTSTGIGESKQLLAEEVFRHIGTQIVTGTLTEGERIRDVDVAEELHVSRTPVREALQRLERLGMVMMYPSRYTEVTSVTAETEAQSLVFAGCQAGIAARLAVPRLTATQRAHVVRLVAAMYATLDDGAKTSDARWAVFSYLGEHCGNTQHRALMEDASMALLRNLRNWKITPTDRDRMRQIYLDFRDAVLDGDGGRAEQLVRSMHYL